MTEVKDMVTVAGLVSVLAVVGFATNTVGLEDLMLVSVLGAVIAIGYKFTQSSVFKKRMEKYEQRDSNSGINYSYQEGKEIINEWMKEQGQGRMTSKKGIQIDQSRSSSEPTMIIPDPFEEEVIQVRHYYVTQGDLNRPVDFFVDVTNGQYFAHKQVNTKRRTGTNVNPFKRLDAYQNTKKYSRRVGTTPDEGTEDVKGIAVTDINKEKDD